MNAQKFRSILLVGAPGAGKGTIGKALGVLPGFFHCSSGDIFRALDPHSELGKSVTLYLTKGELVPDGLTVEIWEDFLQQQVAAGRLDPARDCVVLDGIPRNVIQARLVESVVDIVRVFHLDIANRAQLAARLALRARAQGRSDDASPDVIQRRIQIYERETQPILHHYGSARVSIVDATPAAHRVLHAFLSELIAQQVVAN